MDTVSIEDLARPSNNGMYGRNEISRDKILKNEM